MRRQLNVRVPDRTLEQVNELSRAWGETQAHVVIIAIDRMHQQEMKQDEQRTEDPNQQ